MAAITTLILNGLTPQIVSVEAKLYNGLNRFVIVGLPDRTINESRERITSALLSAKVPFPYGQLMVNLSPAYQLKSGTQFDLAICAAILTTAAVNPKNIRFHLEKTVIMGELNLEGEVLGIKAAPALVIAAKQLGFKNIILPSQNCKDTMNIIGIRQFPVSNIKELIELLVHPPVVRRRKHKFQFQTANPDISDLRMLMARPPELRVLAIAAAGRYNLLFDGPPGSGKTTLLSRFGLLLPPLEVEESLEVFQVHSLVRDITFSEATLPPFRAPHHSISDIALVGGGKDPRPGEITLAHKGVLFLDEVSEFSKYALESLRQPLVDKRINIARAQYKVTFPADFQLLATRNPCPCGWDGDLYRDCDCEPLAKSHYQKKLSGAMLDRIDIKFRVDTPPNIANNTSSPQQLHREFTRVRDAIISARTRKRSRESHSDSSGQLSFNESLGSKQFMFDKPARARLAQIFNSHNMTLRSLGKICNLARTIADLDYMEEAKEDHILEAYSLNCY